MKLNGRMDSILAKEISEYEILENGEILYLLRKYKNEHDLEARNEIIYHNYRLILSVINDVKYPLDGDFYNDLFNEGVLALIKAIDNYNFDYETKFSTYATYVILDDLKRYITKSAKSMRLSYKKEFIYKKYMAFKNEYSKKFQCDPSLDKASVALNVPKKTLEEVIDKMDYIQHLLYIDAKIAKEDDEKQEECVGKIDLNFIDFENEIDYKLIWYKLKHFLTNYEYYIFYNFAMIGRYGKNKFLMETLGTNKANIYTKYKRVLKKIQTSNIIYQNIKIDVKEILKFDIKPVNFHDKVILIYLRDYLDILEYEYLYQIYYCGMKEENFIKSYNLSLDEFKGLQEKVKEVYIPIFNSDEAYKDILDKVKEKFTFNNGTNEIFDFDLDSKFDTYLSNNMPKY